jgi:hypothetical protein
MGTDRVRAVTFPERVGALKAFVWHNFDAFLVIGVALGVLIVEVIGDPSRELVDSAILALLGVTAVMLLRDRGHRVDLDGLRQMASDAMSDRPFDVVSQENDWDLKDRDRATVRTTEQLRFTRNDVSMLTDWSSGDGSVVRYAAQWRRLDETVWLKAEKVHTLPIRNGEKVFYSLGEEHCRGDMLDWMVERDVVGRFPETRESVSLEARTKAEHPRVMRLTWPASSPPTHVEIRFRGKPARTLSPKRKNGRMQIEEMISELPVGEQVEIGWTW